MEVGDASSYHLKVGVKRDWFDIGSTAISVDYADASDFVTDASSATSHGISAVLRIDSNNMKVYATYLTFKYDAPGVSTDDLDLFAIGARLKF